MCVLVPAQSIDFLAFIYIYNHSAIGKFRHYQNSIRTKLALLFYFRPFGTIACIDFHIYKNY